MDTETTNTQPVETAIPAATKFCKHCGQKISQVAVVCPHCGGQVELLKQDTSSAPPIVINNSHEQN